MPTPLKLSPKKKEVRSDILRQLLKDMAKESITRGGFGKTEADPKGE